MGDDADIGQPSGRARLLSHSLLALLPGRPGLTVIRTMHGWHHGRGLHPNLRSSSPRPCVALLRWPLQLSSPPPPPLLPSPQRTVIYGLIPGNLREDLHIKVLDAYESDVKAATDAVDAAAAKRPHRSTSKYAFAFPAAAEPVGPGAALLAHHARASRQHIKVTRGRWAFGAHYGMLAYILDGLAISTVKRTRQ